MVSIHQQWQQTMAEWRHSPCLMRPVSLFMLIIMVVFSIVSLALALPTWLMGILLAPLLSRGSWLIEFLYPLPIARWGHLFLLRWGQPKLTLDEKAANYHSRTIEQRVEVVRGRVFIHPIPQLLDNLGYLVVCLPPSPPEPTTNITAQDSTPLGKIQVESQQQPEPESLPKDPIVAFLVDCGDAETVAEQLRLIRKRHYPKFSAIRVHMILSTHKHHDHTAGNLNWKDQDKVGQHLEHIVGGAVEGVPGCTMPVADGDRLTLPLCGQNDMNQVVHVEVVAVPAHTRGSVVYMLRANERSSADEGHPCFAFTGDTMFSGGGGVPFEAGADSEIDQGNYKDNAHSAIRAGVGCHALERCFAEILYRGTVHSTLSPLNDFSTSHDQFLVFAGHEYTTELLSRQFGGPPSGNLHDANKWKNFPPHVFFETVSQLYVALHRRSLPQATGKVLVAAPTTLGRELLINPYLRTLARRAELVVQAIRLWDAYFSKPKGPKDEEAANMRNRQQEGKLSQNDGALSTLGIPTKLSNKTQSTHKSWTMDAHEAARSVFTTVYTTDLDSIIDDLTRGEIGPEEAALRLKSLKAKLKEPVIRRRPIPGTLPSERVVFKGLIGFALLGSRPSAMTVSDSRAMKLPKPAIRETCDILVSKKRLIGVLGQLGFLTDSGDGQNLLSMIHSLWHEAHEYASIGSDTALRSAEDPKYDAVAAQDSDGTTSSQNDDEEASGDTKDLIELGALKWLLYGFPAKQPSWFSKVCMPCTMSTSEISLQKRQDKTAQENHPVHASGMQRRHGELVRHDMLTCRLCQSATDCPDHSAEDAEEVKEEQSTSVSAAASTNSGASNTGGSHSAKGCPRDDQSVVEDSSIEESVEVSALPVAFREA